MRQPHGALRRVLKGKSRSDGSEYAFVDSFAVEQSGLRELIDGQKVQYDIFPGLDGRAAAENLVILD